MSGSTPATKSSDSGDGLKATSVAIVEPADVEKGTPLPASSGPPSKSPPSSRGAKVEALPAEGEDFDGSRDRALSGKGERSMKQDFYRILEESRGETGRLAQ